MNQQITDDPAQTPGLVLLTNNPQPGPASGRFQWRAITWLKAHRDLRSEVRPEDKLDVEPSGGIRFTGWFARPSTAGWWFYAALCALMLGTLLAMFNPPGTSKATHVAAERAGEGACIGAAACLAVAEVKRRRNRVRALVELRAAEAPPATAASIAELAHASAGTSACLVSERPLALDVLVEAQERGVRCFVAEDRGFHDAVPPAPRAVIRRPAA